MWMLSRRTGDVNEKMLGWEAEGGYLSSLLLESAELLNGTLKVGLVYS